ncbi:unnamed protein product [Calicophoron daubneyi]|uniref:FZ domain-containing protein n=1 Tax=Calicophoron daubneyi TaxID=300641 RepID=A0AAV2SW95_CALDB
MQLDILVLIQLLIATGSAEFVQPLLRINLWDNKQDKCTTETTHCVPIASHLNRTCLGSRLPYKLTAPHPLVEDVSRHGLQLWTTLQAIPACWDKLQFFLCSVYVPECIEDYVQPPVSTRSSPERVVNSPTASLDVHASSSYSSNAMPPDNGTVPRLSFNRTKSKMYRVVLPEAEMCEAVHKACPLLVPYSASIPVKGAEELSNGIKQSRSNHLLMSPLPRFLDCSLYTPGCRQNKLTARLFQSTGGDCQAPLITTTVRQNWLAGIERCSFPCRRPHFDPEHYVLARWITGCAAIICLCVNVVVLVTLHLQHTERLTLYARLAASSTNCSPKAEHMIVYSAERKSLRAHHATATSGNATKVVGPSSLTRLWSPYPPLLCIHVFFLIGCLAWLMPLLPGIGDLVACREDGSLRTGEPQVSSGKSIICVLNFILLYFSLVAAAVWSNILDYTLVIRIQQVTGYIGLIERGLINPDRSGSAELYPRTMAAMSDGTSPCYPTPVCGRNSHDTYTASGVIRQSQPEKHSKPDGVHSSPVSEPDCSQPPSVHESEQLDQSDVKCSIASQPEITSECDTVATTIQGSPVTETAITGETDVIRSAGIHRRSCSKHSHSDVSGTGGITQHQSDKELSPVKTSHYGRSHSQRKSKRLQALAADPKIAHRKRNKRCGHRNSEVAVTTPTQEQIPLSRIPTGRLMSGDSELSLLGSQCRVSMANTGMRSSLPDASSPTDHTAVIYDLESPSIANPSTECPLCHGHCSPPPTNPLIFHAMRVSFQLNCPLPNLRPDLRPQTATVNSAADKPPQAHRQRALSSPNGSGNPAVDPGSCADCFNNKPSVITTAGSCRHGSRGSHSMTTTFPQSACLHLLAFALPLVLTLISLTAAEIDGDSLSGVCFVGRVNIWARTGLIFIPFTVCLIVKAIYVGRLIQEFAKLRCQFSRSPFHVDQEFAHRLTRCSYSYGFFLVVLIGLWLFSCALQTYVYLSEPVWLESQRSLVLCQLSYRLLGLNEEAALNACFNTASAGMVKAGTVGVSNIDQTAIIGLRTARDMSSYLLKPNATLSPDSTPASSDYFNPAVQTSPTTRALFGTIDKPMAGPVLLHLCVFFVLNLIFASVCLFDQSVKRSWRNVWIRFVIKCRSSSCRPRKSRSPGIAVSDRRTVDVLSSYLCSIPQGFSWWDPGLFDIPLIRYSSMFAAPIAKETTLTSEFNQSAEGFASADSKHRIINPSVAASDHHANGLSTSHPAGMDWDSRIQSPSKVSAHCHVSHSTCDLQSNTGSNESRRDGHLTTGGEALHHEPTAGISPFDDILPKLVQLASLYQSSSHDESTLVWLQRLYQQLTAVTMNPTMAPSTANVRTSHDTSSECASASGQVSHSVEPAVTKMPASDVNATSHAPNQPANLLPSMAAVYEQCQKQMAALTGSSRRRSRHRFLFPSRTSVRRRSHSRSMSTSGLFFPGFSSGLRATATGPGSVVSATGSDRQSSVADESLSLLQAVIAAAAATSSAAAGHGISGAVAMAGNRNHRRLSHSGLPTYSAQQLDTSSGATSAFGGSQISSTSVRSGLTGVSVPPESTSERPASITGPALAAECCLPSNLGDSSHPGKNGAVGSRMSLRSLSCASSSGAESYNSYRLLVNQAGASWRELWRTRMLLMDVLRWAETVAPLMQTNNQPSQSSSDVRDYPPPSFEPKVDSSTRGGKDLDRQSETGVPNASASAMPAAATVDWNTQFAQFVSSLLERHQQQTQQQLGPQQFSTPSQPFQANENLNPSGVFTNPTPSVQSSSSLLPPSSAVVPPMLSLDPMMAAAFAAATAAATVALQQQQQQQHQQNQNSQGCVSPMTGYTPATSFHRQTSATPFSSAYSAVTEPAPTYLKTPLISSPNNLQSPTAGVSRSAGAVPQGYPGIGSPPMQVYNTGSPPCMMPHFQSADCLGSSRPNFPQCVVDSRQMLVPGSAPVWTAGQFAGQNPPVATREPVASDGSYPYVCMPQMIPPGHRGPPDLLADHDREAGARMTGISPKCSPPYVTPNTCFEPASGQPLLSPTPPWKGYWQYPVRQTNLNYPGPAHFIPGSFRLEDVAPSVRGGFETSAPDPNVGATAQSFPVPSTNTAEQNAGANQRSSNVAIGRGNHNESNDSDAFDSEDEVISVTDDEQACDRASDDRSKSNGFHIAPVGATVTDGQNMNEVGAPPLGPGLFAFGSVLNGSPYNCNSTTNFPNPLPSTHSNFFGLPVQQQQAECMQASNYPHADSPPSRSRFSPSSYIGVTGADDGEVSSVSQSASQVVPRASSSSSSSSVSASPLLRLSRLQECQQQPTPTLPALVPPGLSSSVENEPNCKQQQNVDNKPVV